MKGRKFTAREDALIRRQVRAGCQAPHIAANLGVEPEAVAQRVAQMKMKFRQRPAFQGHELPIPKPMPQRPRLSPHTDRILGPAPGDAKGERSLWAAVIQRALDDAMGVGVGDAATAMSVHSWSARSWLLNADANFQTVCHLAGIEPSAVKAHFLSMISKTPKTNPFQRRAA